MIISQVKWATMNNAFSSFFLWNASATLFRSERWNLVVFSWTCPKHSYCYYIFRFIHRESKGVVKRARTNTSIIELFCLKQTWPFGNWALPFETADFSSWLVHLGNFSSFRHKNLVGMTNMNKPAIKSYSSLPSALEPCPAHAYKTKY